jgi:hypothetical protein
MRSFPLEHIGVTMLKLVSALTVLFSILGNTQCASAAALDVSVGAGVPQTGIAPRKKQVGDVSYRTLWRLQQRVAAMQPRNAQLIAPVLRLSVAGMGQFERSEFKPEAWAVAIVGKTVATRVPMHRGGYFSLPALPQAQARQEDAIVMFNAAPRRNAFDVGWQLHLPSDNALAYTQFGQALAELRDAQRAMPWWDVMAMPEKRARFDALLACFTTEQGQILVAGLAAGQKLGPHCTLLAFDPGQMQANPEIAFVGDLELVALDNSANYARAAAKVQ